jgi:hypothetical protein
VRIYSHYPVINGDKTTFYHHLIKMFDVMSEGIKDKWASNRFTKNFYDKWMPAHLKKICSVINELQPSLDIVSSQQSELEGSRLSQGLESYYLTELSNQDASSLLEEADSLLSHVGDTTPETSVSQRIKEGVFKKPPKKGGAGLNYISEWSY